MKLKQIVCDGTVLNLTKEKKVVEYAEVFEVDDERGAEILSATYKNKPVAELVKEEDKPTSAATPGDKPKEEVTNPKATNKKKTKTDTK